MDLRKFLEELLIVIVLYKSRPEQSAAYTSVQTALNILPSIPEIFIYDNGPEPAALISSNITYVYDPKNSGVSKAYNEAAVMAGKKMKKWMLFLDQDTHFKPTLFPQFSDAISTHPESFAFVPKMKDRNGLVSPFRFRSGKGIRIKTLEEKLALKDFRFINSGLLIQTAAFGRAGGYDESIPLDFSDIAFGERLQKITDHFTIIDATLDHAFSATTKLPLKDALMRFDYYCRGAFVLGQNSDANFLFLIRSFLRAAHLSLQYKNPSFIKILFQRIIYD